MKKQKGFTLIEMMMVIAGIATIALAGGIIYVGIHFITKFW